MRGISTLPSSNPALVSRTVAPKAQPHRDPSTACPRPALPSVERIEECSTARGYRGARLARMETTVPRFPARSPRLQGPCRCLGTALLLSSHNPMKPNFPSEETMTDVKGCKTPTAINAKHKNNSRKMLLPVWNSAKTWASRPANTARPSGVFKTLPCKTQTAATKISSWRDRIRKPVSNRTNKAYCNNCWLKPRRKFSRWKRPRRLRERP